MKRIEKSILNDIADTYGALSPENLSCDGELSRTETDKRYRKLMKKLKMLFQEYGKEISEMDTYYKLEMINKTP